jgi:hypothetical protein
MMVSEFKIIATQMETGLRIAGQVEFVGKASGAVGIDLRIGNRGWIAIGEIDRGPLQLFDGEAHAFCAARRAAWSSHYERNPRTPQDTRPAPWVLDYYLRKAPSRVILPEASSVSGSVPRDEGGALAPRPDIEP